MRSEAGERWRMAECLHGMIEESVEIPRRHRLESKQKLQRVQTGTIMEELEDSRLVKIIIVC